MILANVRAQLTAHDVRLVIALLARGRPEARARYERRLQAEGPDALLDDPALFPALLALRTLAQPSARLFTYVAIRRALLAGAIDDRDLADYLAALVLEFGVRDRGFRIAPHDDARYRYLTDIMLELESADGERAFYLRAHLGNYALWLAGLFPDYIAARRRHRAGPDLPYYDAMGRRGYQLASDHALADRYGLAAVYRSASERFPSVRRVLNRVSDRVLFPSVVTPDRVLREL